MSSLVEMVLLNAGRTGRDRGKRRERHSYIHPEQQKHCNTPWIRQSALSVLGSRAVGSSRRFEV